MKKKAVDIIWEDEHIVVVNKAAGMLSIADRFDADAPNLKAMLKQKYGDIWTVHRIDRDTSGLLCFAKSATAHQGLSLQFSKHQVEKKYLAICNGFPIKEQGTIAYALAESTKKRGRYVTSNKGKEAITHYQLIEKFAAHSLIELAIETGRTHQIRVHLQAISCPILADPLYSPKAAFFVSSVKGKKFNTAKYTQERPILSRTALHASALGLQHPITGEKLFLEAPMPKDMRASLQQLRKWS